MQVAGDEENEIFGITADDDSFLRQHGVQYEDQIRGVLAPEALAGILGAQLPELGPDNKRHYALPEAFTLEGQYVLPTAGKTIVISKNSQLLDPATGKWAPGAAVMIKAMVVFGPDPLDEAKVAANRFPAHFSPITGKGAKDKRQDSGFEWWMLEKGYYKRGSTRIEALKDALAYVPFRCSHQGCKGLVLVKWLQGINGDELKWEVVPHTARCHEDASRSGRLTGLIAQVVMEKLRRTPRVVGGRAVYGHLLGQVPQAQASGTQTRTGPSDDAMRKRLHREGLQQRQADDVVVSIRGFRETQRQAGTGPVLGFVQELHDSPFRVFMTSLPAMQIALQMCWV
ncbi:hypothetical protein N2152v2_006904 [Parachlorella kessleri]